jgi:hypothetical protein
VSQTNLSKMAMEAKVQKILGIDEDEAERKYLADEQRKRYIVAESIEKKLRESLKPLGFFNIPELLDNRRLEYLIPNGAFESYPGFDKVYIWQISTKESNTYQKGGQIVMPDNIIAAKKNTAPRGIIISAGLKAMDSLYSTGFELGHIIRFKKFAPFVMPVEDIDGHELTVMVVRDGDIEASEDMATAINARKGGIKNVSPDGKSYDFRYEVNGVTTGEKISEYYDPSI